MRSSMLLVYIVLICISLSVPPVAADEQPKWYSVRYNHGVVVSVGGHNLPVPVKLPLGIKPLNDEAETVLPATTGDFPTNVSFYFPTKQEHRIREWVLGLPAKIPYGGAGTGYQIIKPYPFKPLIIDHPLLRSWRFSMHIRDKSYALGYFWWSIQNFNKNAQPGMYVMNGADFGMFYRGINSPTRHQDRLVCLTVRFERL